MHFFLSIGFASASAQLLCLFALPDILPSNATHENLYVFLQEGFGDFKHTQLHWWLARYDWPVSVWVLSTLKTTRAEPLLTLSYANAPMDEGTSKTAPCVVVQEGEKKMHPWVKKCSRSGKTLTLCGVIDILMFMVAAFLMGCIYCDYAVRRKSQGSLRRDEFFKITLKEALLKPSILYSRCQSQCHYAHVCWRWRDYTVSKILKERSSHLAFEMLHWNYAKEHYKRHASSTFSARRLWFRCRQNPRKPEVKAWGYMRWQTGRERREENTVSRTGRERQRECISFVYTPQRTHHSLPREDTADSSPPRGSHSTRHGPALRLK